MTRFFQPARRVVTRPTRARLTVESLEAREVPAVLTVNTAADNTASDAVLTLREAISLVNSGGDPNGALGRSLTTGESNQITGSFGSNDTIAFNSGLLAGQTITLSSALPQISMNLSIAGIGANQLAVSGNHAVRVFSIANGVTLNLAELTIKDGQASDDGGGILNLGTLNLAKSAISGNQVTASTARGGGLFNSGVANITDNTFSDNQVNGTGGQFINAHGGGVFNLGTMRVTNSTFSDNHAIATGTSPQALGGAIFNGSTAIFVQSTLSNNSASGSGGPSFVRAGGVYNQGTARFANTILAGNQADSAQDVFGTATSQGFNLVGIADNQSSGWVASDLLNRDPLLGALADNGGPTPTHALLAGSPAIDAGSNALAVNPQGQPLATDQRGLGFDRVFVTTVDIGSLEDRLGLPFATATSPDVLVSGGTTYQFTVTYVDPHGMNNGIDVSTITVNSNEAVRVIGPGGFDVPATYLSIDDDSNGTPRTATYSIAPPGGTWNDADIGVYTVVTQANKVVDLNGNFVPARQVATFNVEFSQTFVVTTDADSGTGSLRNAITQANAFAPSDTIIFSPTFFNTHREISLLTPLPQITNAGGGLTIAGPGVSLLTVHRDSNAGAFRIFNSNAPTLTLSQFTVSGGIAASANGAGLLASGIVSIDGMVFANNTASSTSTSTGNGGAIHVNAGGFLNVRNSTIAGNTAGLNGGGISWSTLGGGSLILENSTVSGNSSTYTGSNKGYYGGGGIYFSGPISTTPPVGFTPGTIVIRNSTIANNSSAGSGGGVFMDRFTGTLLVQDSTISGNSAATSGTSGYPYFEPFGGGGLQRNSHTGIFGVANSVVSGNTNGSAPDIGSAAAVNVNYSAIGNTAGFTLTGANNLIEQTLLLGPLQNNGGPTQTMAPEPGSPLIDTGSSALAIDAQNQPLATDQRGAGFPRQVGASVDIGAFEVKFALSLFPASTAGVLYNHAINASGGSGDINLEVSNFDAGGTGLAAPVATPNTLKFDSTPTAAGNVSFDLKMTDEVGAMETRRYSFVINAPISFSPALLPTSILGAAYNRSITAIDGTGDKTMLVTNFNDGGTGLTAPTSGASIATFNSTPTATGTVSFDLTATDTVGATTTQHYSFDVGLPAFLTVNTVADNTSSDAFLSLREAISLINSGGDANEALGRSLTAAELNQITGGFGANETAMFDAGVLTGQTITLGSALPQLSKSVTITGLGANQLAISGNHAVRVFSIASGVTVNLSGLTIKDGQTFDGGAGILNFGTLTLSKSTLTGNQVTAGTAQGGGLFNSGVAIIADSTFSNNQVTGTGGQFINAHGGGAYNFGTLTITNSTFAGNQAIATGASPQALGGAIFSSGHASIIQSTISENVASGTGGPSFVRAGGIFNQNTLTLANTIIAGNEADSAQDFFGTATSYGFNLIGLTDNQSSGWVSSDLLNLAPKLGPLANNGGPTQTIAPLAGSPAIDAGSNSLAIDAENQPLTGDQRGDAFPRISKAAVDIGAIEVQPPLPKTIAFIDADGDKVVVKLSGPGEMRVTRVNGTAPIKSIELTGTSAAKSILSITVKKKPATKSTPAGDGRIGLGSITGSSVRVVQARQANLDGAGINLSGPVASINLADLKNGADIITTGGTPLQRTRLTLAAVSDSSTIDLDNPINRLTVKGDFAGDLTLDVPGIAIGKPVVNAIIVTGAVLATANISVNGRIASLKASGFHGMLAASGIGTFRVKGDLTGDVALDGVGIEAEKPVLNFLNVLGSVTGSDIRVSGNVNRVQATTFSGSTFFAGYTGANDGSGVFIPAARVNSFVITGKDKAFQNSHVIASSFKNVSLRSVKEDNGDIKFGFIANDSIVKLTVGMPVPSTYKSGDAPLVIDDFEVRVRA